MKNKKIKRLAAAAAAVVIAAGSGAYSVSPDRIFAGEIIGETSFEYKIAPWQMIQNFPARQVVNAEDGALHAQILHAEGGDHECWDLQTVYSHLNFKKGHSYKVSFKARSNRDKFQLVSKISNIKGDEEYFVIDDDKMHDGPSMGGTWGSCAYLTSEYQTFSGTFVPQRDLENCVWSFQYAKADMYFGNGQDGDELWLDDISIVDETADEEMTDSSYGAVNRDYSGTENNFISVNQLGYFNKAEKIAVLGDNAGDMIKWKTSKAEIKGGEEFSVVDDKGTAVFHGKASEALTDEESGDTVVKLDFSELDISGRYHIECGIYRSPEFAIGDVYSNNGHSLVTDAVNYFYQSRSGADIESRYITSGDASKLAHKGKYKTDTAVVMNKWTHELNTASDVKDLKSSSLTVNGGWYESEDFTKDTVSGGMAVWTLLNMFERDSVRGGKNFEGDSSLVKTPEDENSIPDILDECIQEIEFIRSMKVDPDEPTWGSIAAGMIYSSVQDYNVKKYGSNRQITSPYTPDYECDDMIRIVKPPTFAATLNYAAAAAQLARLIKPYDSEKAEYYLNEANAAYDAYEKAYYEPDRKAVVSPLSGEDTYGEDLDEKSLFTPSFYSYGDIDVTDDDYRAACELFISCSVLDNDKAPDYLKRIEKYEKAYEVTDGFNSASGEFRDYTAFNAVNTGTAGSLSLLLHKDLLTDEAKTALSESLIKAADCFVEIRNSQGYGVPYVRKYIGALNAWSFAQEYEQGYKYGSNNSILNNAIVCSYAYDQSKDSRYFSGVSGAMDYILGTNPLSFSYVTGCGEYAVKNPRNKYWLREISAEYPSAPDGVISSGPNASLSDFCVQSLGMLPANPKENSSQRCYADSVLAWSVNDTSLNANASLSWMAAFLKSESDEMTKGSAVTAPSPSAPSAGTLLKGDVNSDGKTDLVDLSELSLFLIGDLKLSEEQQKAADVDGDGKVLLADLAKYRQYLSKVIESLTD